MEAERLKSVAVLPQVQEAEIQIGSSGCGELTKIKETIRRAHTIGPTSTLDEWSGCFEQIAKEPSGYPFASFTHVGGMHQPTP